MKTWVTDGYQVILGTLHSCTSLTHLPYQSISKYTHFWVSEVLIIKSCTAKKNTRVPISSVVWCQYHFLWLQKNIVNVSNKINSRVYDRPRHVGTKSEFFYFSSLSLYFVFVCLILLFRILYTAAMAESNFCWRRKKKYLLEFPISFF